MQSTLLEKNLQLDFDWLQLRHKLKDSFVLEKLPDLNAVLLFIGIQELGKWKSNRFKKEEKQDLMHIAVCTLMTLDGYYRWDGLDTDGWPHYAQVRAFDIKGEGAQDQYLRMKSIEYFNDQWSKT
ncbi:MAG: hypothetical protein KA109_04045 [Saprospiraceae bacterium]|jgi:hypothetical protein|nr:hypothetical protein [Saprospiraceae bacterium]MBK6480462.1 hypothetical protein [Saprospiraceae bacterium]MBK6817167.1 hypothetical protein [Saprospiraceae bacterium]MBK7371717.1 hypothetical protein [Saprospiraceae bacterium]MBK7435806.1 hypothetical protein [Saprospiraceae bacterium]